jgi:predicted metal-dependent peptidase
MNNPAPAAAESCSPALKEKLLQEFSKARTRLVARVPFLGYLAMQMRPKIAKPEHGVPTCGIAPDGTTYMNPQFMDKLSLKEFCGVLAHEVMHPALHFWIRKGNRNHKLANIAHDLSFNFLIEEIAGGEITLPEGVLLDPKFHGMAMEEIYGYLQKGDNGDGKTTIQTKGGGSITVDANGGDGEGDQYVDCRDDLSSTKTGKQAGQGHASAQKKLANDWKQNLAAAAQQHEKRCKSQGSMPAGLRRYIDSILHPQVEWQDQLRRWCGENGRREEYSFARPNRRSESIGVVLPSQCAGGLPDVVFLIDSSGSMSDKELVAAKAECFGILEEIDAEVRVLVCDAALHVDEMVDDVGQIEMKGGGGSDFRPAFDVLAEDGFDGAVIAFTDGMICVPDAMPYTLQGCLWITGEDYSAPTEAWGEHIAVVIPDYDV